MLHARMAPLLFGLFFFELYASFLGIFHMLHTNTSYVYYIWSSKTFLFGISIHLPLVFGSSSQNIFHLFFTAASQNSTS